MLPKIILPVALFAITAGGAAAFSADEDLLAKLNLTSNQTEALEKADEVRREAHEKVQAILKDAGIDMETMHSIKSAEHTARAQHHKVVREAVQNEDFEAYRAAVANTPFEDTVTTEEEFAKLIEAHKLHESGEHAAAKILMEEIGLVHAYGSHSGHPGHRGMMQKMNMRGANAE